MASTAAVGDAVGVVAKLAAAAHVCQCFYGAYSHRPLRVELTRTLVHARPPLLEIWTGRDHRLARCRRFH